MLPVYPTYRLVAYVLVLVIGAIFVDGRRPVLPVAAGLTFIVLYGENGATAAVMVGLLIGVVDGLVTALDGGDN
jgi:hypothetical protein